MSDLILNTIESRDGTVTQDIKNLDATTVSGVTASQGMATAWVNFDGTNGVIRDSYNVSSVTRVSAGIYDIIFATPMDRNDYVIVSDGSDESYNGNYSVRHIGTPTTTTVRIQGSTYSTSGTGLDGVWLSVIVFGGKN